MHPDDEFQDLSEQTILDRFKKQDKWLLEDIVLLAFGYEYEDVDWGVTSSNTFPARQYHAALEATNNVNSSGFLKYVHKDMPKPDYIRCQVRKGPFIQWANKQWGDAEPRVRKTYNLWRKYKLKTGSVAPSLQSPQAKVKNYADQIQIAQYKAHMEKFPTKKFNANIVQIAKQVKAELSGIDLSESTCKRYIVRIQPDELAKHLNK